MRNFYASLAVLVSANAFADGQTVPVPGDLQKAPATSIQVTGTAGSGQADQGWSLIPLKVTSTGEIKRATGNAGKAYKVNQLVSVKPGKYLVDYSVSYLMVDVREGQQETIELQKISVPKVDGSYTFKVFQDLTNKEMQDRRALWQYVSGIALDFETVSTTRNRWGRIIDQQTYTSHKDLTKICAEAKSSLKTLGKESCGAYDNSDYRALDGGFFKFNSDGTDSFMNVTFNQDDDGNCYEQAETMTKESRAYISSGIDGEFISVMPGTYGIEMKNSAGVISSRLGITVQ